VLVAKAGPEDDDIAMMVRVMATQRTPSSAVAAKTALVGEEPEAGEEQAFNDAGSTVTKASDGEDGYVVAVPLARANSPATQTTTRLDDEGAPVPTDEASDIRKRPHQ